MEKVAGTEERAEGAGARRRLGQALAAFREGKAKPWVVAMPVKPRAYNAKEQIKKLDRRKLRKLIKPENALALIPHLPVTGEERLHALIAGDFVYCDLLTAIVAQLGAPRSIWCATLSLSQKNVLALEALAGGCPVTLLVSHYFSRTNAAIFAALRAVETRTPGLAVHVARSHCKVTLFDFQDRPLVVEGSANLRSSGNLEQVSVFCDRGLLDFHREWIEEAAKAFVA